MIKKTIAYCSFFLPSFLTVALYRLVGYKVGKNCKLPIFSVIYGKKIEMGNDIDIRSFVFINVNNLTIGDNSFISYFTFIKGNGSLRLKGNSGIGMQSLLHCDADVEVGFYSGFGVRNTVYSHSSFLPANKGYFIKKEKIILEDFVWLGANVSCFAGTYIEENTIISPGLVISGRIKGNSLVTNNPSDFKYYKLPFGKNNKPGKEFYIKVLKSFAEMNNYNYKFDENEFSIEDKYIFEINAESETVILKYNDKLYHYDFNNFTATYLKNNFNKKFLSFIKREFGIFLRTKY